jgi:hypothetical protein
MGMPEMRFIFFKKLKEIYNGYARNVIFYFYFLVLSFANLIRNFIRLLSPLLYISVHSALGSLQSCLTGIDQFCTSHSKRPNTHTHTQKCFYDNNKLPFETIVITHSEKYLNEFGGHVGHLIFINIPSRKEEKYYTYSLTLQRWGE